MQQCCNFQPPKQTESVWLGVKATKINKYLFLLSHISYCSHRSLVFCPTGTISDASVRSSTNLPIEGSSIDLTCDAAGSIFTRMWKKTGSDLVLTDDITLYDNNRVLSFKNLNKSDSGLYSCNISNPVSAKEATYMMLVNCR